MSGKSFHFFTETNECVCVKLSLINAFGFVTFVLNLIKKTASHFILKIILVDADSLTVSDL